MIYNLRFHFETSKCKGETRYIPYVFLDVFEALQYLMNKDTVEKEQNNRKPIGYRL